MARKQEGHHRKATGTAARGRARRNTGRSVQRTLNRATQAAERAHRALSGFVFDALEKIDRLEKPVARVRKLQDRSITATYQMVRGVNREVDRLVRGSPATVKARSRTRTTRRTQRPTSVERATASVRPAPTTMTGTG